MHGIIATWRMALEGIEKADAMLKEGKNDGHRLPFLHDVRAFAMGGFREREREAHRDECAARR